MCDADGTLFSRGGREADAGHALWYLSEAVTRCSHLLWSGRGHAGSGGTAMAGGLDLGESTSGGAAEVACLLLCACGCGAVCVCVCSVCACQRAAWPLRPAAVWPYCQRPSHAGGWAREQPSTGWPQRRAKPMNKGGEQAKHVQETPARRGSVSLSALSQHTPGVDAVRRDVRWCIAHILQRAGRGGATVLRGSSTAPNE